MYDVIVARLRCPACGAGGEDGLEIEMQVWWTRAPFEAPKLRVGDCAMAVDPERVAGYLKLGEPAAGAPLRVLDAWDCSGCYPYQWAMTTVDQHDERIVSVEAVRLSPAILDTAHYISSQLSYIYPEITGEPLHDERGRRHPAWRERLVAALAAGRSWPPRA